MRAAIENRLNRTWYGDKRPGWILGALEIIYRLVSGMQRRLARLARSRDLENRPIVVVGNLAAGGSGKTPVVIRLCELATECGLRPGVVSRGYGRTGSEPLRVTASYSASRTGDEPLLIARRCGVPVQVDANRERATRVLFNDGVDIVIADDGLQRASLPRLIEICVIDERRGIGNGRQLPAGPLRESPARLKTVDYVVHHGQPAIRAGSEGQSGRGPFAVEMHLRPSQAIHLTDEQTIALDQLGQLDAKVHAVAGIADPERFFSMLAGMGIKVTQHPFPDHHHFNAADFDDIPEGDMILMTEKDAVKCIGLDLPNAWYLPVDAMLGDRFEAAIKARFIELAGARGGGR